MGPGAARAVGTEEVVENSGVDGLNCVAGKAVVICFNFGALVVVRTRSGDLDQVRIPSRKFSQGQVLALQGVEAHACLKPVELLFLVADLVVLNHDVASQVAQQVELKLASLHRHSRVHKVSVHFCPLVERLFVLVDVVHQSSHVARTNLVYLLLKDLCVASDTSTIAIKGHNKVVSQLSVLLEVVLDSDVAFGNLIAKFSSNVNLGHHDPGTSAGKLSEHLSLSRMLTALSDNEVFNGLIASTE